MGETISGYTNQKIDTNLILRKFPDGGYQLDDNFCNLFNLSPGELDRLALYAPMTRRLLELVKDWKLDKDAICPWCGKDIAHIGHALNCPRENVLEDIQAMGLYDLPDSF